MNIYQLNTGVYLKLYDLFIRESYFQLSGQNNMVNLLYVWDIGGYSATRKLNQILTHTCEIPTLNKRSKKNPEKFFLVSEVKMRNYFELSLKCWHF